LTGAHSKEKPGLRIIPQLDTYPRLVTFVQTPPGKIGLLAAFALLLTFSNSAGSVLGLSLILTAITFFPKWRRMLVTVGTLAWLLGPKPWIQWDFLAEVAHRSGVRYAASDGLKIAALILLFGFCALCWWLVIRFKRAPFARRPIVSLHLLYAVLLLSACIVTPGKAQLWLWWSIIILGSYFWFLCYSLTDRNAKNRDGFFRQLGGYHPFWGSSPVPYPKGASYLRKTEALSDEDFAITQLKGVKLLIWAEVLNVLMQCFLYGVHGEVGAWVLRAVRLTGGHFPRHFSLITFSDAMQRSAAGVPCPWYICWPSVIADFAKVMLTISVSGHRIIACCRMAGFRAARNTYRPLESRNIADFWNRYYFYFKELLVEFFFFPTYMRYFKRHPRLRMLAATFAAAGLGNMIYHFMRDIDYVFRMGLWKAVSGFQVYAFYAVALSAGIGISQLRSAQRKAGQPHWFRARVVAPGTVLLFYCVLHVFDDTTRVLPLSERFVFLMHMFGLPA
jgi:hypothetical protein